ncbi:hypothetical protein [Lentzea guizhouensis]|uniref:hypothetical protein n=1 Tax=Lentzea guizhouensis TaxID=1586287 RepID=UPI0012B68BFB|nr:hypothetical protein [Lentzea guizhouensis]
MDDDLVTIIILDRDHLEQVARSVRTQVQDTPWCVIVDLAFVHGVLDGVAHVGIRHAVLSRR